MQNCCYYSYYPSGCCSVSCRRCAIASTTASERKFLKLPRLMQWPIVGRSRTIIPMGETCYRNNLWHSKFFFLRKDVSTKKCWSQPSNCHFWVKRPGVIKCCTYFITKTLFRKNKEIQYAKLLLLLVLPIGMLLRVLPTMCHCINHCVGTKILEAASVDAMAYRW